MTLASDITYRAQRQIGQASENRAPTAGESNVTLAALNGCLTSYFGNGIGPQLSQRAVSDDFTVENGAEYVVDTTVGIVTGTLWPGPFQNGCRIGFQDAAGLFGTHYLNIAGAGRLSGTTGAHHLTSGGRYFYRAATGWELERTLALSDPFYLDDDLIDGFTAIVALMIGPEFGQDPSPVVIQRAQDGHEMIWRRYGQVGRNDTIPPLRLRTPAKPMADA